MLKILKKFSVPLMSELFHEKVNDNDLRNQYEFSIPNVNSVFHGQESISYLGPLIWQLVLTEFKDLDTAIAFKTAIRKWKRTTAHEGYVKLILEMLNLPDAGCSELSIKASEHRSGVFIVGFF